MLFTSKYLIVALTSNQNYGMLLGVNPIEFSSAPEFLYKNCRIGGFYGLKALTSQSQSLAISGYCNTTHGFMYTLFIFDPYFKTF